MKITKNLKVATDKDTGAVTLSFIDEHGIEQIVSIPSDAASLLSMALIASPPSLRSDGTTKVLRYLNTTGSETASGNNGNHRLSFRLADVDNAFVHLSLPPQAIPVLIQQLSDLAKKPPSLH